MEKKKPVIIDKDVSKGCVFIIVIFIVIIFFLFKSCGGTSDNSKESKEEKHQNDSISFYNNATDLAEKTITNRLNCPSTAKFQSFRVICFNDSAKGDTVRVIATFDAQNLYGAMVRDYEVVDEIITGDYHSSEKWEVIRIITTKQMMDELKEEMKENEK